jgi:hypothetical protein
MSRYTIILRKPPEIEAGSASILQFGFDKEITLKTKYKPKSFYLLEKEKARIGFICENDQDAKTIFFGSKVHFYGKHKFFCKSITAPGGLTQKAICCTNLPTIRVGTIIVRYSLNQEPEVMPWVFGKIMFDKIKDLHYRAFPIDKHDYELTTSNRTAYKTYDIMPYPESLWPSMPEKQRILEKTWYLRKIIKSYIAEDLNEEEIRRVVNDPSNAPITVNHHQQQRRPPRPIGDDEFGPVTL